VDKSSAQGTLVEAPKALRGMGCRREGVWEGTRPLPRKFFIIDLKMEHFGAVYKLDLMEETRTQFARLASYWLRLWAGCKVH